MSAAHTAPEFAALHGLDDATLAAEMADFASEAGLLEGSTVLSITLSADDMDEMPW